MYTLRPYQREAVEAVYAHLRGKDTNPCVVIPTAGGKSLCIAEVAKDAVTLWGGRVMILAHVKELVEQNAAKAAPAPAAQAAQKSPQAAGAAPWAR